MTRCCATCAHAGWHDARTHYTCGAEGANKFGEPVVGLKQPCVTAADPLGYWQQREHGPIAAIARRFGRALVPSGKQLFRGAVLLSIAAALVYGHDTLVGFGIPARYADLLPVLIAFWAAMQVFVATFFGALDHLFEATRREIKFARQGHSHKLTQSEVPEL
jgi:hypothetical protein